MKNIIHWYLLLLFCIATSTFAQDDERVFDEYTTVIPDNQVPEPAPIFYEDNIPQLDKDTIKARLKKIQKQIPLLYNSNVYSFIHYFTVRNRDYSRMVLRRRDAYFPIFEKILKERNLPDELKYLAIVESGLNARARSRAGAVGLWQFMSFTGKHYGLSIDWYVDERSDPVKATYAACDYLKYLYNMFDDWELALAAYNCGPGNVRRAIKAARNKRDFWEIFYHLPRETRSYVPQFIAIAYLMNYHKEHNLEPEYLENQGLLYTYYTDQYINLEVMAKQLDMCVEDLQRANPTLLKNVVPGHVKAFPLRIPADKFPILMENLCLIMDSCSKAAPEDLIIDINPFSERSRVRASTVHVVRKGEVITSIASKYKVSVKELKEWNNLKSAQLKYGQKLTIWRSGIQQNTDKRIDPVSKRTIQVTHVNSSAAGKKQEKKYYQVQPGDTLWSIAQKTEIPIDKLKKLNKINGNEIKPGQRLILSM